MRHGLIKLAVVALIATMGVTTPIGSSAPVALAANGCGAEGGLSSVLVPNGIPGVYDFTNACNNHDNCYGTAVASKGDCDATFRTEMLESCNDGAVCGLFAELYAAAVRNFGDGAYFQAQWQADHEFAVSELVRAMVDEGLIDQNQGNEILNDHGITTTPDPTDDWFDSYDDYSTYVGDYDDYGMDDTGDYGNAGYSGYDDNAFDDFGGGWSDFDSWGDVGSYGDYGGGGGGGGGGCEYCVLN